MLIIEHITYKFGHNFDADQNFGTKFGTVMDNEQPKGFRNIQDGERPPS